MKVERNWVKYLNTVIVTCVLIVCSSCAFSESEQEPDTIIEPRAGVGYDEIRFAQVFDATGFTDKPDLSSYGIRPIMLAYHVDYRPKRLATIAEEAAESGMLLCLDIERYPIDPTHNDELAVQRNLNRLSRVADYIHMHQPGVRLGFYRMMPLTFRHKNSWRSNPQGWRRADQRSRYQVNSSGERDEEGLSDKVDVLFPSLYALGPDLEQWKGHARATIALAREHKKQVYPFIWFEYHGREEFKGQRVDPDMFREMMLLCLREADGVVIWGGVHEQWDPDAPWVKVMQEVALSLRRTRAAALDSEN